jgi:hypothetical protein
LASLLLASVGLLGCGSDDVASSGSTESPLSSSVSLATTNAVTTSMAAPSSVPETVSTPSTASGGELTALTTAATMPASTTADGGVSIAGVSFTVPEDWSAQAQALIGTEFQAEAQECLSAEVIDSPVPEDAGSPASSNAVVQVCAVDPVDVPLESWLAERGQAAWTATMYGGCAVLEVSADPVRRIAYTDTAEGRVEIVAVVSTTPEQTELRRVEVGDLLDGMRCTTT